VGIGLSAVLLFPMLASYWFLGGEKGLLWWLVVSAGLAAFVWVWTTTFSEMLTGRPIGQALIGAMGRDDADEATQRRIVQILAALLYVAALAVTSQWELREVRTTQWGGLFLTLVLSGFGITFSLPAGIMLALGRRSKMPVVSMLCTAFIELFRSVPLITVLFMANTMLPLFMPEGTEVNHLLRAIVAVCLFAAAYMAEVVRGGLQAMPRGQYEAAASLGLGYWQTTQLIIMPQALKIMIPTIVGNFIGLLKDTTLVSIIGLKDLMSMARAVGEDGQWLGLFFEPFFFVALIYFVICFAMSSYSMALERKLGKGRDRG
jgi:general L-amino acid transport system permease protein